MSADKVIAVALNEVGYLEKKTNAQLDSKTANAGSNNYTKYARDFDEKYPSFYNGKKNGYAWCDIFVDWCVLRVYGEAGARQVLCQPEKSAGAGCPYSAAYYKAAGRFGGTPMKGAQIFFQSGGTVTHTGLVYAFDNTYVYTVEGNTSGASGVVANGGGVCKKTYARSSSSIYGYGYPRYTATTTITPGWKQDDNGWWYQLTDGTYPKECWRQIGGQWYYFDRDGYRVHDTTVTYDGKTYTFDSSGHMVEQNATEEEGNEMLTYDQFREYMARYEAEKARQEPGKWSQAARDWAVENGVFQGDEHGDFNWKSTITREQVAVILYRMATK